MQPYRTFAVTLLLMAVGCGSTTGKKVEPGVHYSVWDNNAGYHFEVPEEVMEHFPNGKEIEAFLVDKERGKTRIAGTARKTSPTTFVILTTERLGYWPRYKKTGLVLRSVRGKPIDGEESWQGCTLPGFSKTRPYKGNWRLCWCWGR